MSSLKYEIYGAFIICSIALIGKFVESSAHFHAVRQIEEGKRNYIPALYECFNIHLHLSLGMLGLAWSQNWSSERCVPLFIFIAGGLMTKGTFASLKPNTLKLLDFDAFMGLHCPNILAFVCVLWTLFSPGLFAESKNIAREPSVSASPVPPPTQATPKEEQIPELSTPPNKTFDAVPRSQVASVPEQVSESAIPPKSPPDKAPTSQVTPKPEQVSESKIPVKHPQHTAETPAQISQVVH